MNGASRVRWIQAVLILTVVVSVGLLVRVAQGKQAAEERERRLFDRARNPRAGLYVPIYETVSTSGEAVRLGQPEAGTRQASERARRSGRRVFPATTAARTKRISVVALQ